jgi:hypothetical protein
MVYEEIPDDSSDTIPVETGVVLSKMEPLKRQESLESQKENQANQIPSEKKSMQKSSQPLKGKKSESKAPTGQQKNMMSFFGKKN